MAPVTRAVGTKAEHLSPAQRAARGKAAREGTPRSSQAEYEPGSERADPVDLLEQQAAARVPELVPIRYGRMLVSPFSFYRGAAKIMANDLARTPVSGFTVQSCGDAHLSNFGVFGSPERKLVFDLNDFDETAPGPWEWDVKRLATSMMLAARDNEFRVKEQEDIVLQTVATYRRAMAGFASMSTLGVWYAHVDADAALAELGSQLSARGVRRTSKALAKARTKDSTAALSKLTREVDGRLRIVADPPLITPIDELMPDDGDEGTFESLQGLLASYQATLEPDMRALVGRFELADVARKVVGVGSVGTRAWIALLLGRDSSDPLFLQVKEAEASVLEQHVGATPFKNHGERVVVGQRLMQASSDIFLGWLRVDRAPDGKKRDFYVRQLKDWKGSAETGEMVASGMATYGRLCGWTLARAHARTGDPIAIGAYLGKGSSFDRAILGFAIAYSQQTEDDYRALAAAVDSGRIAAQTGL